MLEYFRTYQTRPWPRLEIPAMRRPQLYALILYTATLIATGWWIWFTGIQVEKFLLLGLAIPILFFLKSPFLAIVGLLAFEVVVAFLFIGNSDFVLAVVAAFIGAIIAFESPILMYMLLIGAVWFDSSLLGVSHPVRLELVISSGLLLGWLFRLISSSTSEQFRLHFPERLPILLLYVWAILGAILWCPDFNEQVTLELKSFTIGIFVFLITPLIVTGERHIKIALWAWIAVATIAGIATYSGQSGSVSSEAQTDAAQTLLEIKNITGAIMRFSFFLGLASYRWTKSNWGKSLHILILVFLLISIVKLQSRGTVVFFAIGLTGFWLTHLYIISRSKTILHLIGPVFLLTSAAIIFLIGVYRFGLNEYIGTYSDIFFSPLEHNTVDFRKENIEISYNMIRGENHPFRGLGLGAFVVIGPQYGFSVTDPRYLSIHSMYVDMLVHFGVIGILLFIWSAVRNLIDFGYLFRRCYLVKYKYLYLALICSLISFYLHGIMEFTIQICTVYWAFFGLGIAVINVGSKFDIMSNN